jgi:imidazoleglycerol-phosphate dehydratase
MTRIGRVERITKESKVLVEIDLDGTGRTEITTGVPFYDHMLDALGKHGAFDLTVEASGDVHVDVHHTVEDVAIVLGQALRQALGDKKGVRRFGDALIPMDETLAQAVVDVSGRPYTVHTGEPDVMQSFVVGGHYPTVLNRHVFESLALPRPDQPARAGAARARPAPHHRGPVQGDRPGAARRHRVRRADDRHRLHQGHPLAPARWPRQASGARSSATATRAPPRRCVVLVPHGDVAGRRNAWMSVISCSCPVGAPDAGSGPLTSCVSGTVGGRCEHPTCARAGWCRSSCCCRPAGS